MGPGLLSTLHFLALLRSLGVAIMAEIQKVIFLLDSEAVSLSYLSLQVLGPMTKVIIWGKSGQPLQR
jgi:hypothetical protein